MSRLTANQIALIAGWCAGRSILGDRVTASEVKAACLDLGIAHDGDFDLYDVKEVGAMVEDNQ
ncbi:hypothetical protein QMM96_22055 [Citrobacter freundii]|uniref:hypothetical protein n=1 Tax=Citrobacter freundii TaxID=546 RepID=UPI002B24AFC5|nr:hypothetical protein [Citrobacter freundii]MEB2478116.1 hypothetical protein [Citrobacter freundii]